MNTPNVIILMGSIADEPHARKIANAAEKFGLIPVLRVGSAHKTAAHLVQLIQPYEADPQPKVYVTIAGRSNALSGFVDGLVQAPVIACPPSSETFGGADVFSSLRMPSGIAAAVILDAENAALMAAKIIGLTNPDVRAKVAAYKREQADKVIQADGSLVRSQSGDTKA